MSEIERLLKQSIHHVQNNKQVALHCTTDPEQKRRELEQVAEIERIRKEQLRLERTFQRMFA